MPLRSGADMPALEGATEWIGGEAPESGAPTLVHFWAVSCYLCKENLPKIAEYEAKYAEKGLRVVGIHRPRQPEDLDRDAILAKIAEHGIAHPVAVDSEVRVSDAFENDVVPSYFLFDAEGKLRSRSAGAHGPKMLATPLDKMFPA